MFMNILQKIFIDHYEEMLYILHPRKHEFLLSLVKWRNNIALSFGYDPLYCDKCKGTMTLTDLYFNHKRVPLEDMYERAIAKFKCRSS